MDQLVISLRGEVLSSNFDAWKEELVARIQAVQTDLRTDAQFARAEVDVKRFREAEAALQKAKQSALDQAADIQKLFAAIDEVSEEVRQVRLSLSRQIRDRKKGIKDEFIQGGIEAIRSYIAGQDDDFQSIDHSEFVDRGLFEDAAKYKSNVDTLGRAIDAARVRIQSRIDDRAKAVKSNAMRLDSLPIGHQALFQDRGRLLALEPEALDRVIDRRLAVLNQAKGGPDTAMRPERIDGETGEILGTDSRRTFVLELELHAARFDAELLLGEVKAAFANSPLVRQIRLRETG